MKTITTQREWSAAQRAHALAMIRAASTSALQYAVLALISCAVGAAFAIAFLTENPNF